MAVGREHQPGVLVPEPHRDDPLTGGRQHARAAAAIGTGGWPAAVTAVAYEDLRAECIARADAIVTELRKVFDKEASTLTNAHARIGAVPLADAATIIRQGADIAAVCASAQTASATIGHILNAWSA